MTNEYKDNIQAVVWDDNGFLKLLDQRVLPAKYEFIEFHNSTDLAKAITDMVVRGAPAIGVAAAYAVVLAANIRYKQVPKSWKNDIEEDLHELANSRPTAVNLFWAIERMRSVILHTVGDPTATLLAEAKNIHNEDIAANHTMGDLGAKLLKDSSGVLTHCNAGALATGGYGTALGVIRSAWAGGHLKSVYADETRPWLQGSRLTAWELIEDDIPVTLIAEGAAAALMQSGKIQWIVVGSDRIAANGDVANKIGTYGLAIMARHHGVKFMVAAPTSTIDMSISDGSDIPIENRSQDEVLCLNGQRVAANDACAWNPAFDVTPASLVDAIVTEKGVVEKPDCEKMLDLMG